jgi:hypothetical protein
MATNACALTRPASSYILSRHDQKLSRPAGDRCSVCPASGVPSQRTLECVAVRIAETGNHATKLRVTFDRRLTWFDAGDAATVDSQSDIVGPTARQQGFAGNQRGH